MISHFAAIGTAQHDEESHAADRTNAGTSTPCVPPHPLVAPMAGKDAQVRISEVKRTCSAPQTTKLRVCSSQWETPAPCRRRLAEARATVGERRCEASDRRCR